MGHNGHFCCSWFSLDPLKRPFIHISPLHKSILYSFQFQIQWDQFLNVSKIMPNLMGTFTHFYKEAFCRQIADPLNPLFPSYWDVQKYSLIQSQWNHSGYFSYNQRCPRSHINIFRALLFSSLLCCLLWLFPTLVDEVDRVFGEGPEDLKTLMNQASSPLTMMNHFTSWWHFRCFTECMIYLEWQPC